MRCSSANILPRIVHIQIDISFSKQLSYIVITIKYNSI